MISYYKLYIINYVWFWITADWDVNNIPACSAPANVIWTQLWLMCILVWCSIYSAVQRRYSMYTVEITHFDLNFTIIRLMIVSCNCIWSCTITFLFSLHYCFCPCPSSGLFFFNFLKKTLYCTFLDIGYTDLHLKDILSITVNQIQNNIRHWKINEQCFTIDTI